MVRITNEELMSLDSSATVLYETLLVPERDTNRLKIRAASRNWRKSLWKLLFRSFSSSRITRHVAGVNSHIVSLTEGHLITELLAPADLWHQSSPSRCRQMLLSSRATRSGAGTGNTGRVMRRLLVFNSLLERPTLMSLESCAGHGNVCERLECLVLNSGE